jgi:hypothetical protein
VSRYRSERHAFAIDLPPGSEVDDTVAGAAMVAVDAGVEDGFRTNLVVTVDRVQEGTSTDTFTDASLAAMESSLRSFLLLDRAEANIADGPATRTLVHHDHGGWSVTLEQWRVVTGSRGLTLSASAATLDYPEVAPTLTAAAESLTVGREPPTSPPPDR